MEDGFRKVLIIAYYFPPMGLSGVQRTLKFAKYLPKYGWKPTVLTVTPAGYYAYDDTLLKEADDAGIRIIRTKSRDINHLFRKRNVIKMPSERIRKILQFLGDFFFIPDTKIGWKSTAVKTASNLLKNERFDLIFATAPPQTDFLIGVKLKKKFKTPLVVDYRDSWLDLPFKYFPTPIHRILNKRLEKRVLKAADKVIVTHRQVKEKILRRFPFINYNEIMILSQGFDPEDLQSVSIEKRTKPLKMRIVHSGTFYADRNPQVFLHALANVLRDNPKIRGRIEVRFVGNYRKEDVQLVKRLDLQNTVEFTGYLSHLECIKQIISADVLWFVIDNDFQTPGKLYEYFGARKPILASTIDGYTKQLIQECKAATCVPLKDVTAHEKAILDLFKRFEQKKLIPIPESFSQRFNRILLTGELAKQFESLMDLDTTDSIKVKEVAP